MINKLFAILTLLISANVHAAAPVVYQAKSIVALFSDNNVLNSLPGGYITEIKYRSDLTAFSYEIISGDYLTKKICSTPVVMKVSNNDDWNPEYSVDTIGSTVCK